MRRFVRFGVWSVVVLVVLLTVVNLTVAKLPAMSQADGTYISLRGKEIHYFEQPGQGPPVVMIHGLPGTHKDFDPVLPHLRGRHVIAIDRPGFGWSKGGWLPYQDQIELVHEMLTRLRPSPAIVVGHSFGGAVSLGLARSYPQDIAKHAQRLAATLPQTQLLTVDGNHMIPYAHPDVIAAQVLSAG